MPKDRADSRSTPPRPSRWLHTRLAPLPPAPPPRATAQVRPDVLRRLARLRQRATTTRSLERIADGLDRHDDLLARILAALQRQEAAR